MNPLSYETNETCAISPTIPKLQINSPYTCIYPRKLLLPA